MVFHDEYARLTPFELTFPDREVAEGLAADIRAEAETRGADIQDWGAFNMLGTVAGFLERLREPEASTEATLDFGSLVYHAFHFLEAGAPVLLVDTHAARYLADGAHDADGVDVPSRAGYAQLPRHLFWIQGEGDHSSAEAVDGFFWFLGDDGLLRLLLAVGMREGRPGLGVVRLAGVPFAHAPAWLGAAIRDDGRDFATTLPGGDLEGLYSLTASGEVLKLAARLFAYLGRVPGALGKVEVRDGMQEGGHGAAGSTSAPAPSSLPYRRVTLHA